MTISPSTMQCFTLSSTLYSLKLDLAELICFETLTTSLLLKLYFQNKKYSFDNNTRIDCLVKFQVETFSVTTVCFFSKKSVFNFFKLEVLPKKNTKILSTSCKINASKLQYYTIY